MDKTIIGYLDNDNNIIDTQSVVDDSNLQEIYYDNSPEALEIIRHSSAHLMAHAITELYGDAQFFVGPTVDEGFYYDFRVPQKIGEEDLKSIEKKMKELIKKKFPIEKYTITKKRHWKNLLKMILNLPF